MSDYLIILHDAEPPTDQGREQLQQELIAKLGITEDAAREMFTSLPVILKENVSRQHAEDFLRVLESIGANVEIIASGDEDSSGLSTHSEGETPLLQIKEEETASDDDSDFDLSLEQASSVNDSENTKESKESVEDLEAILSTMLNGDDDLAATPSGPERSEDSNTTEEPDPKSEFFVEQEDHSDAEEFTEAENNGLSFVLDAEEDSGVETEDDSTHTSDDDGPSIDDLNRMLEEELGGVTQSVQTEESSTEVSSAALAFSLDTDEAEGEEQEDLESLVGEALASFGSAEGEAESDTPSDEQPAPDTSEVLFSLEGETDDEEASEAAPATTSTDQKNVAKGAAPQKEDKPTAEKSGGELTFSLDEPEDEEEPSESALEAALSNLGAESIGDDEEEDPFAGLDLPGTEDEKTPESSSTTAGKTISEKKAEKRQQRKDAEEKAAQEEIATAFNTAAKASERDTLETPAIEESTTNAGASGNSTASARKEKFKQFGIALVFAVLFAIAIKPDLVFPKKDRATLLNSAQLDAMLEKEAQRKQALSRAQQIAAEPTIQRWASDTKTESGQRVSIEILTNGNKIMGFEFLYEGPQPKEITPEELIEGIDRPWVRKITANALSLAEVVERTTSKTGTKKILVAESPARAYVSDLQGSTRFAGTVRVELEISSTSELKGNWQVHTDVTPAELLEEEFHVKRLEEGGFELSLNGNVVMTPLTLASSDEKSKKAD